MDPQIVELFWELKNLSEALPSGRKWVARRRS